MSVRFFPMLVVLFATLAPAAFPQTSTSATYNYARVSFPGAPITNVNGINNSNVIAGSYYDSQYSVHGFTYSAGKYTAVNFPGATMTEVLGINDNGDIVGAYQLSGALNFHGFVRRNGTFIKINDPSARIGTMAFGINKTGAIVGSYDNAHGFVFENGTYKTVDAPYVAGPHQTQLNGINNLGWIAGQVYTGGVWRGFWITPDHHLHFIEPVSSTDSEVTGINNRGDIVGCHDTRAGFVSFAVSSYTSAGKFPHEQSVVSCASAVNDARVIVGSYSTVSNQNGFLAVPR